VIAWFRRMSMERKRFDTMAKIFADRRLSRRAIVGVAGAGLAATVLAPRGPDAGRAGSHT